MAWHSSNSADEGDRYLICPFPAAEAAGVAFKDWDSCKASSSPDFDYLKFFPSILSVLLLEFANDYDPDDNADDDMQ